MLSRDRGKWISMSSRQGWSTETSRTVRLVTQRNSVCKNQKKKLSTEHILKID